MIQKISDDLIVACEIYCHNQRHEPIWFGRLVEKLKTTMSKNQVSNSLDTLTDWLIISGGYGSTGTGRVAYLYEIDLVFEDTIANIQKIREANKND